MSVVRLSDWRWDAIDVAAMLCLVRHGASKEFVADTMDRSVSAVSFKMKQLMNGVSDEPDR